MNSTKGFTPKVTKDPEVDDEVSEALASNCERFSVLLDNLSLQVILAKQPPYIAVDKIFSRRI